MVQLYAPAVLSSRKQIPNFSDQKAAWMSLARLRLFLLSLTGV